MRGLSRALASGLLALTLSLGFCVAASAQSFTLTLQPNTIPSGTNGQAYNQLITAVGGNAPYTFAVTSGTLPPGISLATDGTLSGTPTTPNNYSFTITATDVDSNTGYRPYTFSIGTAGGLSVSPSSLPNGTQGVAYNQIVTASGGSGGYVYSISAGSLPGGLTLNSSTGAIAGTPSAGGTFNFTVHVLDSDGNTGSRAYSVSIGTNSLTLSPTTLPNGTQGSAYSQTVTASGGTAPYTYSIASGSLPAGLSMDSAGHITGTPTGTGSSSFTVRAIDADANYGTQNYTVNIGSNILTVSPTTLPNGTVGSAYSQTITASGGSAPYTFAVTSGALPGGLSLSSAGVLSGTPTASGPFTFTVTATDPSFNTGSQSYTVTVNPAPLVISPASLPAATLGSPYSQTVTASGGTAPYSYTLLSGALPAGMTLGAGGLISGTPTAAGSYSFTVQATDATPNTGTRAYTINVGSAILTVSPASLPNGTSGTAYSQTITASGGTGPYTFSSTGALPSGLTLSSGGVLSGTPTAGGSFSFTVNALDSLGNTGSQAYTVNIGTNTLTVSPASLPAGTNGTAYNQSVSASGGTGPYSFTISAGALPAGLTLSSAGLISGTPSGSGASSFTVRALDTLGNIGTHDYTVSIGTVSLTVNPATLPDTVVGHAYSQTVSASGGTAPYTFAIVAGALPAGLTLNAASGLISGTPTASGDASFTVQASDVNGNTGSRAYTFDPRPDPAADPDVQGLVSAQVAATQRFASAQSTNVAHHLEGLHGEFTPCSYNFGIAPPIARDLQPYGGQPYATDGNPANGYNPYAGGAPAMVGPGVYAQPLPPAARPLPGRTDCAADWATSMAAWSAGSFQFGSMTPSGLSNANKFYSAGLTSGIDYRVNQNLIVGAALGYGGDRTDVGQDGTRSNATSMSAMLYASLRLYDPLFLDTVLGYGALDFDNYRWVGDDGTLVSGKRKGSYWFGKATLSLELSRDGVKFTPYVGADYMAATLNGYSEGGTSSELLTFEQSKFSATSVTAGLRGSVDVPTVYGVLSPTARLEYRDTWLGGYDQSMYYSDLGAGMLSALSQPGSRQGVTTASLGLRARGTGGLTAEVEYGVSMGSSSLLMQSIRASLRLPF